MVNTKDQVFSSKFKRFLNTEMFFFFLLYIYQRELKLGRIVRGFSDFQRPPPPPPPCVQIGIFWFRKKKKFSQGALEVKVLIRWGEKILPTKGPRNKTWYAGHDTLDMRGHSWGGCRVNSELDGPPRLDGWLPSQATIVRIKSCALRYWAPQGWYSCKGREREREPCSCGVQIQTSQQVPEPYLVKCGRRYRMISASTVCFLRIGTVVCKRVCTFKKNSTRKNITFLESQDLNLQLFNNARCYFHNC